MAAPAFRVLGVVRPASAVPRAKRNIKTVVVGSGELTSDDYDYMKANIAAAQLPHGSRLAAMKERHHHVARLAITGASNREIAQQVGGGITEQAVAHILKAPATVALLANLREAANSDAIDIASRMSATMGKALRKVDEALDAEETPAAFSHEVFKDLADRGGFPAQKNVQALTLTGRVDTDGLRDRVRTLREQSRERVRGKPIEAVLTTTESSVEGEGK